MRKIEKKTWPDLFEKIASGQKKFDLRLADFEVREGNILVLREWDPEVKKYTGRKIEKKVTFLLKTKGLSFWPQNEVQKHGFVVMSLE